MPLASIGGRIFDTARTSASIWLLPHDKGARPLAITVLLLPHLTLTTPRSNLVNKQWHHLQGIRLADPSFTTPGDIDLVLGTEAYARIIRDGVRSGSSGTPTAQNSTLGWLVFGGQYRSSDGAMIATSSVPQHPIADVLQRFWSLEEVSDSRKLSVDEEDCERQFSEGCRRDSSGRYIIRLPLRKPERLPASWSLGVARRALARVQAKMKLNPEYACEYRKFMSDYEALGHMRVIPDHELPPNSARVFYLPHHAIQQVSDQTRKFRVVFNASCKVGRGPSINECLHTGPPLQSDLVVVICKWLLYQIAVGADIEKMYHQILVDPADIDLQRILWLGPDGRERHYQLLTVTYGVSCAPYLALRVIRQLAHDEAERFPRAAQIMLSSSYVDDILYGADDISTARQLRDELIGLTKAGGFRLHKWSSSHPQVLDDLEPNLRLRPEWKDFSPEQPVRTLGVAWDPSRDELWYRLPNPLQSNIPTKREALSIIARFFNPLGWVSPILVLAKVLLQDMWRDKLDWDDVLPSALNTRWQSFIRGLLAVTGIRIPRWIGAFSSSLMELHGFADASKGAYAAVV